MSRKTEFGKNICEANDAAILTANRINYDQILRAPNMIEEEIMVSKPVMEVINFLDQIIMELTI